MIRHQFQPSAKSCGQTCLAMLLDVPVAQVIAEMPDRAATHAGQLCAYLVLRGWTATRLRRVGSARLPSHAIVRLAFGPARRVGHWILWVDGTMFDPSNANGFAWLLSGGRPVSYIALAPPGAP